MPVPPDFMINLVAPHLGVRIGTFWLSTFLGVISTTLIHTAIGEELGEMTSSADFHFFSFKNLVIVLVIGIAMLVPIFARRFVQSPEDTGEAQGAISLDNSPGSWRNRVESALHVLLAKIHPSWRGHRHVRSPSSDEEELSESVAVWRDNLDEEAQPHRALQTMPTLSTAHVFSDGEH